MKKLLEKRNLLVSEMKEMLDKAEAETRALDVEVYGDKEKELEALNETIKKLETRDKGEITMETKQMETRDYAEEIRAMTTTTHSNVVNSVVADEIIKKLEERCPLFAMIPSLNVKGDFTFLIEQEEQASAWLEELEEVTPVDLKEFKTVKATDKRNSSITPISKKLILNSVPAFTMDYIQNRIADRVIKGIEGSFFKKGVREDKELTSGLHSISNASKINSTAQDVITIEDLIGLAGTMKQHYLNGAKWVMNRKNYAKIVALSDNNGRPFLVQSIAGDKIKQVFLGLEVIISESIDDETIALINGEAFRFKFGQPMQTMALIESYAKVGQIGLLVDVYMDCVLVNEDAVKLLNLGVRI